MKTSCSELNTLLLDDFDENLFHKQTIQDTVAFRSNLPIWTVNQSVVESLLSSAKDQSVLEELFNIAQMGIHEGMKAIVENIDEFYSFFLKHKSNIMLTSYSNSDALTNLFKGFITWEIWEFAWSIYHSTVIWENENIPEKPKAVILNFSNGGDEGFQDKLILASSRIFFPPSNGHSAQRKCTMFAGPLIHMSSGFGDQGTAIDIGGKIATIFRRLLKAYHSPASKAAHVTKANKHSVELFRTLTHERIHSAANLRQPVTSNELKDRLCKAAKAFRQTFDTKVQNLNSTTLPHDYLIGVAGAVYFWKNLGEKRKKNFITEFKNHDLFIRMPKLKVDSGHHQYDAWLKISYLDENSNLRRKSVFTLDCQHEEIVVPSCGGSGRLLVKSRDGQREISLQNSKETSSLFKVDNAFSQSLMSVRTSRHNFLLEQKSLFREWLNDNVATWGNDETSAKHLDQYTLSMSQRTKKIVKYKNGNDKNAPAYSDVSDEILFPRAVEDVFERIGILCFRLFRADHFSLYFYGDRQNKLLRVGGLNNTRKSKLLKTGSDGEIVWEPGFEKFVSNPELAKTEKQRKKSLSYRCLKKSLQTQYSAEKVHEADWVRALTSDTSVYKGVAFPKSTEANDGLYLSPCKSEIAVDLRINGRVWGVMILSGYHEYQFEAATQQALHKIGRLFAQYLYQAWSTSRIQILNKLSLKKSFNSSFETGVSDRNFEWGQAICDHLADLLLVSGAAFWVREGSSNVYKCIGISSFDGGKSSVLEVYDFLERSNFIYGSSGGTVFEMERKAVALYDGLEKVSGTEEVIDWFLEGALNSNPIDEYFSAHHNVAKVNIASKLCCPLPSEDELNPLGLITLYSARELSHGAKENIKFVRDQIANWFASIYVEKAKAKAQTGLYTHSIDQEMRQLYRIRNQLAGYKGLITGIRGQNFNKMARDFASGLMNLDPAITALVHEDEIPIIPSYLTYPKDREHVFVYDLLTGILRNEGLLGQFRINFDKRLAVRCSETVLRLIFYNLIDNAKKYKSPRSKLTIRFTETFTHARLSFINTGLPLSAEEMMSLDQLTQYGVRGTYARAAERNQRTSQRGRSYNRDKSGQGIGLAIVSSLASDWRLRFRHSAYKIGDGKTGRMAYKIRPRLSDGQWIHMLIPASETNAIDQDVVSVINDDLGKRYNSNVKDETFWHSFSICFNRKDYEEVLGSSLAVKTQGDLF